MKKTMIGDLIQLTGILMLGAGLFCEFVCGGDIYLIVITAGAVIFSVGTKIKGK